MSLKQTLKSRDGNRSSLTPEAIRKSERKGSVKNKKRIHIDSLKKDNEEDDNDLNVRLKRPVSRENRALKKFSHAVYSKAALMLDHLIEAKGNVSTESLGFESEFERRRAYSLAFAAKRYEAILKDVLLDSSFYSSYFKLETFHHTKVLVMLLDFYEHNFRFSESSRKKVEVDSSNHIDYIHEIQTAFFQHKIKLCSAFARNRIKACALSLDAMLPVEVKERGECGSRHSLCAWINPFLTDLTDVIDKLREDNYELHAELSTDEYEENEYVFSIDPTFQDLLVFPPTNKDDVYNSDLVSSYSLIPQSRPRYLMAEIVRRVVDENYSDQQKPSITDLVLGTKIDELLVEGCDIVLTHPETGSLAAHICSFINKNKRLYICGCHNNKKLDVEKHLRKMGVEIPNEDFELIPDEFHTISPSDPRLRSVKLIFCNPPCSKSGVVNPVDFILQEGSEAALSLSEVVTKAQVRGFAEHQAATLRNALLFGFVQAIVYTTFSTHSEENESLVKRLLHEQTDPKDRFEASHALSDVLESMKIVSQSEDSRFVGVEPSSSMDGFFAALLTRKVKEDSVRDIMDRAAKKGLVKKSSSGKTHKKSKTMVGVKPSSQPQQPPHVANRITTKTTLPKTSSRTKKPMVKGAASVSKKQSDDEKDDKDANDEEKTRRFKF